jgi:toxin FitB
MMILVDTNVFSELTKPRADDRVVEWLFQHRDATLLSTIVAAELDLGIRNTPGAAKRALLTPWLARLIGAHKDRVVAFDLPAAQRWAEFASKVLIAEQRVGSRQFDTLIAAQAMTLGVPLATRNRRDFENIEVSIIDPWSA